MKQHRIFRAIRWLGNLLLAMVILGTICMSVSEFSFGSHLADFSDAIVPQKAAFFTTPEIK